MVMLILTVMYVTTPQFILDFDLVSKTRQNMFWVFFCFKIMQYLKQHVMCQQKSKDED